MQMTSPPLLHCHDQAVVRMHRRIGLEPGRAYACLIPSGTAAVRRCDAGSWPDAAVGVACTPPWIE